MGAEVVVITVPANEWQETKAMIKSLCEKVEEMTTQGRKELLTPNEVCKILKIGRNTFERLKNNGDLPVQRTKGARKIYVTREDLEQLMCSGLL